MAAGDNYFDCSSRRNLSLEQVIRDMIVEDANENSAWRVYGSGGGGSTITLENDENTASPANEYTLTTPDKTVSDIFQVFVDGKLQFPGVTGNYTALGTILTFDFNITGFNVQIFYK